MVKCKEIQITRLDNLKKEILCRRDFPKTYYFFLKAVKINYQRDKTDNIQLNPVYT